MKTVLKVLALGLTAGLIYLSGFLFIFAMFLRQFDGIFAYGLALMIFGLLLRVELKYF